MGTGTRFHLRTQPAAIELHAAENLQFIRDTMERAASFTAVPGEGGVVIGVSALAAGFFAHSYPLRQQVLIWLCEGLVAACFGMAALHRKSKLIAYPLSSRPAKRALLSFAAPMAAGMVLTVALYRLNQIGLFAGLWLLLYGVAVITAGAFSVRIVPVMGLCFFVFGCAALVAPSGWNNLWMTAGFGGLHVLFGVLIARKHGG